MPNSVSIMGTLGWVYYKNGMYKKAEKVLNKALAIAKSKKDLAGLRYIRSLCYLKRGLKDKALDELGRAIGLNKDEIIKEAKKEKDFEEIRNNPRFKQLMKIR